MKFRLHSSAFILSALCLLASAVSLFSAAMPFGGSWQRFMPPQVTDARLCLPFTFYLTNVQFEATLPPGDYTAVTVVAWLQIDAPGQYLTTSGFWCADPVQRYNPDLLQGRGGFPTNTTLSGALTFSGFSWQPYAPGPASNVWPRGVYTVAGWSSNQVSVTLGGFSVTLGPGEFNRNVVPGAGPDIVVSGSGLASVGISRTPAAQWFNCIDGVRDEQTGVLTKDSIITNEFSFCAWRLRFEGTNQLYRSDLARYGACGAMGQTQTNALPESGRTSYSSRGLYRFGLAGLGSGTALVTGSGFGARVVTRWLTDDELCRIKANDEIEMARRALPRWMELE